MLSAGDKHYRCEGSDMSSEAILREIKEAVGIVPGMFEALRQVTGTPRMVNVDMS